MKTRSSAFILIPIIFLLAASSLVIGQLMLLASQSYRNADRNNLWAEAMKVAESELEYMFYEWQEARVAGNLLIDDGEAVSYSSGPIQVWRAGDESMHPTQKQIEAGEADPNWMDPYLATHAARWKSLRTLSVISFQDGKTSVTGAINDETGSLTRYEALVTVTSLPSTLRGTPTPISVQVGRRFSEGELSPFQSMFSYTGVLELYSGSAVTVAGAITANGDAYLSASTNGNPGNFLQIKGRVSVSGNVNGIASGSDDAGNAENPDYDNFYDPNHPDTKENSLNGPSSKKNPDWVDEDPSVQISKLQQSKEITGMNPSRLADKFPEIFNPDGSLTKAETVNNARHLVIDPPTSLDKPAVAAHRMYNKAGMHIIVDSDGDVSVTDIKGNPLPASVQDTIKSAVLGASGTPGTIGGKNYSVGTEFYDMREEVELKMTTLDVSALKTILDSNPGIADNYYNGVVYIRDESENGAIRLINGDTVPGSDSYGSSGQITEPGLGFTVVTDKALYVQGDFNSQDLSSSATGDQSGRVSLMADSVTVLSSNWDDANATAEAASADGALDGRESTASITINAGVLTGNVATDEDTQSGGAHNLIRLLEDWGQGKTFNFKGSLGQIFESNHFSQGNQNAGQVFLDEDGNPSAESGKETVTVLKDGSYYRPQFRNFTFDPVLAENPPKGSPVTTIYSRGDFFTFTR